MKQYYIYQTTNLINNKKYIGQHYGEITDNYFGSGTAITRAIEKYGKENFSKEILCICQDRKELDEKEKYFITLYNAIEDDNFYNLQEGGQGGDGWRACKAYLQNHPEEAKKLYKANGERISQWVKDNPEKCKENTQRMLDASRKWQKENPDKVQAHMQKVQEGKIEWQKNHPEEYKKQVDAWRKSGSDANSIQIICITTGEVFPSISEAGRAYNVPQPNISKCLKGQRKSAGKHPDTGEKLVWDFY